MMARSDARTVDIEVPTSTIVCAPPAQALQRAVW
jgi:hypothetical protein